MPSRRDDRGAATVGSTHRSGRRRPHQGQPDLRLTVEHGDRDARPRQDVFGNPGLAGRRRDVNRDGGSSRRYELRFCPVVEVRGFHSIRGAAARRDRDARDRRGAPDRRKFQ
jgi:hypothetical protein